MLYSLLYINTDEAEYTEILGIYSTKEQAVMQLLERANYRERDGKLTQYMEYTDEYESFSVLKQKVMVDMELFDVDVYRISEHNLDDKYELELVTDDATKCVNKYQKRSKPN